MTTTRNQIQHQPQTRGSTAISIASEDHSWSNNYRLLRKLYPKWDPNDEELREVWFRCFDKDNGLGADLVCQDLLRDAIVEARQVHTWNEPNLELVSKLYRNKRTERLLERERAVERDQQAAQAAQVEREHRQRIERISRWSEPRRQAAVSRALSRFRMLEKHRE